MTYKGSRWCKMKGTTYYSDQLGSALCALSKLLSDDTLQAADFGSATADVVNAGLSIVIGTGVRPAYTDLFSHMRNWSPGLDDESGSLLPILRGVFLPLTNLQ